MTAAVAHRRQAVPTGRRSTAKRPALKVLDQASIRRRARRRNALLLLFVVVLNGLFVVAFVHAQLVESQQDLDLMRTRISELEIERSRIERAVDEASSPAQVVEGAGRLGMVRAENPIYLAAVGGLGDG